MTAPAADGTVFRTGPDRRGIAFAAVYVTAAPALAAGAFGFPPVVRWGLAAVCAVVAVVTAAELVRRAARTEVTAAGIVLRRPLRAPSRHAWEDIAAFEAVHTGVLMRLRGGGGVVLPGIAGRETGAAAAALSARLGPAPGHGRQGAGPMP